MCVGESLPLSGTIDSTDDNYLETKNVLVMQGTHCISGSGIGVVVSTGDSTVFGKDCEDDQHTQRLASLLLEREVVNFVIIICSIMLTMIIVVIIVW